jgi:PAT family beta-lactamase induction signal transducer AmpG
MGFSAKLLRDRRYLSILLLGFSSGLPLLLVGGTLRWWLSDAHIDLTIIGIFNLVALPYALKFLWAPVLDRMPLPFLTSRLGRRRGWLLLIQSALTLALLLMAQSQPDTNLQLTACIAFAVACFSASQDVVIDALRIEMLEPSEYALGSAVTTLGYRIGMLAAGAGAFYLAELADWRVTYDTMAALVGIGVIGMIIAPERQAAPLPVTTLRTWFAAAVIAPVADFTTRAQWPVILAFIVCYKLATVLALSLISPFYHDLGFTKIEVANITKIFGLAATIAGGFIGVWIIARIGLWCCLLWSGIAQAAALYLFWGLAKTGHNSPLLIGAILSENVTGAIAATAFVTYISSLCNKRFTATQFALFTAMAALTSETLTSSMGFAASALGWTGFFAVMPLAALPGLGLLLYLRKGMDDAGIKTTAN